MFFLQNLNCCCSEKKSAGMEQAATDALSREPSARDAKPSADSTANMQPITDSEPKKRTLSTVRESSELPSSLASAEHEDHADESDDKK